MTSTEQDHDPGATAPANTCPAGEEQREAADAHPEESMVERAPTRVEEREPVLPRWATDRETLRANTRVLARRWVWRAGRTLVQLPRVLAMLVAYSPRGLARVTGSVARYLYDQDTADLRHHHARNIQTAEYQRAHAARRTNLHARWVVAGTLALAVAGPVLVFLAPTPLCVAVGVLAGAWVVKLIPGRGLGELAVGAGVAGAIAWFGPGALALIPRPPLWPLLTVGVAVVLALGWHGRNRERRMVPDTPVSAGVVLPLRADVVTQALCDLGNSKMKDPESIRVLTPPVRYGQGYQLDVELPGSVKASWVVGKREDLAAALKRELGCVWPERGRRHAAHLILYVADQELADQPQRAWPLAKTGAVDLFAEQPLFTDKRGTWVTLVMMFASMVIGAVPRMGKTFILRSVLLVCALDVRPKLYVLDGKGTGDLSPLAHVAHFYSTGDDPEEIDRVLAAFRALRRELRRRTRVLNTLPKEQAPESKVTSALASRRDLGLEPIVIGIDETQIYFGYGDKSNKEHKAIREELAAIVTDLVKRGPALGVITLLATQQVNSETVPTAISNNIVYRVGLKLEGHEPNDRILGTGAYKRGIDAQMFSIDDKGIAYLKGDGRDAQIVRSVAGLDTVAADKIGQRARALREAVNRLTGDARGEEQETQPEPSLLDDVRAVMADARVDRIHLGDLRARLALRRSETWSPLTVEALGVALREAGVPTPQVKIESRNTTGVRVADLDVGRDDDEPAAG